VSAPAERVLGWRVWRLRDRGLHSRAADYRWVPGENRAVCLAHGRPPCRDSPGPDCNCGLWAAWNPWQALTWTCAAVEPPWQVMGLVELSGAVVAHGADGLRAERATLRCLLTDRPWSWWLPLGAGGPETDLLRSVAEDYAVPLLSLSNAMSLGLADRGLRLPAAPASAAR
jgi:hypothetical protein